MRVLLMFDLPTITKQDLKNYRKFRKYLLTNGFLMMQESIYTKIVLNPSKANTVIKNLKINIPNKGLIQVLVITEKQYNDMIILLGEVKNKVINSEDRLVDL